MVEIVLIVTPLMDVVTIKSMENIHQMILVVGLVSMDAVMILSPLKEP